MPGRACERSSPRRVNPDAPRILRNMLEETQPWTGMLSGTAVGHLPAPDRYRLRRRLETHIAELHERRLEREAALKRERKRKLAWFREANEWRIANGKPPLPRPPQLEPSQHPRRPQSARQDRRTAARPAPTLKPQLSSERAQRVQPPADSQLGPPAAPTAPTAANLLALLNGARQEKREHDVQLHGAFLAPRMPLTAPGRRQMVRLQHHTRVRWLRPGETSPASTRLEWRPAPLFVLERRLTCLGGPREPEHGTATQQQHDHETLSQPHEMQHQE